MNDANQSGPYDAVVFDLLTALIDSWTLWNRVAGSAQRGLAWRTAYLKLTYETGAYRRYETILADAAAAADMDADCVHALIGRWGELEPWPEARGVLTTLAPRAKLGVVTNCSVALGHLAAGNVYETFDAVVTAEEAGFYKPNRQPYAMALDALGTLPERTLFVAGSAADVPGASALGMTVYWHNRIGAASVAVTPPAFHERSLNRLLDIV